MCEHNFFVIAASVLPVHAAEVLATWQKRYPHAMAGAQSEKAPHYVPIIVDYYLTLAEAEDLVARIAAVDKVKAYVQPWNGTCGGAG